jgi:hypothetical protein
MNKIQEENAKEKKFLEKLNADHNRMIEFTHKLENEISQLK